MSAKLDNPDTASKTYLFIIGRFSKKKKGKFQPYHLFPLIVNLYLISSKNLNFLILILLPSVLQLKMRVHYQILNIEPVNVFKAFYYQ